MNWTEIKEKIYYCDGSLRDIYILQTNMEDNKKWTDFVNEHYTVKWFNGLTQTDEKEIDFEVIKGYLNREHDLCSSASIFLDKIQINNHFFIDSEIENDISPKEINSLQDHERIISYMIGISKILNKPIILTPENEQGTILIKVTKDIVELMN
jgi:hypothetical protein